MAPSQEILKKLAHCATQCDMCADACLDEKEVQKLVKCIRLDRDCAKICNITASLIASGSDHAERMVKECEYFCRMCAKECDKHDMEHCQQCAKACRECEVACQNYSGVRV